MNYALLKVAAIYLIALVLYCMACAPIAIHGGSAKKRYVNQLYKRSILPDPRASPAGYDPVNDDPRHIPEQFEATSPRKQTDTRGRGDRRYR